MKNIISVERLKRRLAQNNIVIVDVRFDLMDADAGRKAYLQGHIPGSVYMDLNRDLSGKAGKHGGNHPLPDWDLFARKLGKLGISNETTVVVYDQGNDMYAPRFWWLLDYLGHEKIYILDGGIDRWVEKGGELTSEVPNLQPKTFRRNEKINRYVDMEEVREKLRSPKTTIIDSRAPARYLGDEEPLYSRAGHIPGAVNYFWKGVLKEDGTWKNEEQLREHFSQLDKDAEIIVSCGSGVSACPNILALDNAGFTNVKLYPGSFSDWISYDKNEVAIGEEDE
ncbi:sulfurtransferase [Oceanobacillus sp. J11TS1]|uniref:sulfurtransferase n=1 Tax=Oceanobacillus sp. J11TS1 TaxID=2807191 RepID=UPI001B1020C1|nr:sulfurtransferase [Oceanobacillus sp. J11TS1]GIO24537.1 thiosulfate sulfurtransferase [Oceanobacillus sp. J11TS1]